jgi:hypothetical protein
MARVGNSDGRRRGIQQPRDGDRRRAVAVRDGGDCGEGRQAQLAAEGTAAAAEGRGPCGGDLRARVLVCACAACAGVRADASWVEMREGGDAK